ncbi:hypothetical protein STEG23_007175 [Scotinomys teguina]
MQPGRTTNTGGGTMEVKAAAPRCQLLLILLMSAVMLLPGTNGSLLLVQRTVTRTIVLQETIGKGLSLKNAPALRMWLPRCAFGDPGVTCMVSDAALAMGEAAERKHWLPVEIPQMLAQPIVLSLSLPDDRPVFFQGPSCLPVASSRLFPGVLYWFDSKRKIIRLKSFCVVPLSLQREADT